MRELEIKVHKMWLLQEQVEQHDTSVSCGPLVAVVCLSCCWADYGPGAGAEV